MLVAEQALVTQSGEPLKMPDAAPLKTTVDDDDPGEMITEEGAAVLPQKALFAIIESARLRACSAASVSF
jgi:hypothetical protein